MRLGISRIAVVLSESARIPLPETMCPRNLMEILQNSHLLGLRVTPMDSIRCSILVSLSSCSFLSAPKMMTSSIMHNTLPAASSFSAETAPGRRT